MILKAYECLEKIGKLNICGIMSADSYLSQRTSNPEIFLIKILPICLTKEKEKEEQYSHGSSIYLKSQERNVTISVTNSMIMLSSYSFYVC